MALSSTGSAAVLHLGGWPVLQRAASLLPIVLLLGWRRKHLPRQRPPKASCQAASHGVQRSRVRCGSYSCYGDKTQQSRTWDPDD